MKRGPIKQLFIFGLAVALIFTLTSCGKSKKDTAPTDQEETTSSVLTNEQESDSPHGDSVEPITTPLETDYFSLSFPDEWCTDCCYEIQDNAFGSAGYTVKFKMNQAYCGNYDGWLFSLCVTDDYSTFYERYDDYVGLITVGEDKQLYLIAEYPTEVQVESAYNELYDELCGDIPQILNGIWVTNSNSDYIPAIRDTAENQVEENDIPFLAVWSEKIDVPFSPSALYTDVTGGCLTSDGKGRGYGVGTVFGAYELPNVRYYWLDDGCPNRYYGVKDGNVVAYMDEGYGQSVRFYIDTESNSTPPKIVNYNGLNYLEWKIMNGYLVLETINYGTSIPYS